MENYWVILVIVIILAGDCDAMTREQLKKTGKMLRKQCLAKVDVEEDKISQIEKGKFVEEKEVMCYVACIYQMTQIVKNNKLSYESAIKQVDLMYPADMKASVKSTIEKCKDVSKKYKDVCEASYWTAKCMYDDNPKDFIFA
uniref:Odorant binding protein n=1 Tax=Semiothisa cinerearia TaxID=2249628 RepID=A0A889XL33_9NEOP|nr:odorant binding protein [Semiothisa cinerearia]